MKFSASEKERRLKAFQRLIEENGLDALLLIGDTNVGHGFYGDLRYYTNNRIIFYRQIVAIFPKSDPVLFTGSGIQTQAARRRSFVSDCRQISEKPMADIVSLFKERGVSRGRIGVNFEMLPVTWFTELKEAFPEVEWVETHDRIMDLRYTHSKEEVEAYRTGGVLCDGGFEAALKVIRPGVTEYEIAAEIEHYARARGAEEHFTLIGSGRFSFGDDTTLPLPYAPGTRRVEKGDSVVMEITPRYEGYWTQLVRTVNVGAANSDLEQIQDVCVHATRKSLEAFRPGKRIGDVVDAMASYVTSAGYLLKPPLGHVCGVDLVESRVAFHSQLELREGMAVIIHPTVFTPDGKVSFFWGETYLVTGTGYERIQKAGDELLTL